MEVFVWMYFALLMAWVFSTFMPSGINRKFTWITGFTILWLIQALREYHVGTDLNFYINTFLEQNWDSFNLEIGYEYLNRSIYQVTDNATILITIISFITLFPISILFKRYSTNIILSYIIFASFVVYHFSFSGLRQSVAIGILAFSYVYIYKQKIIPFLVCVFIAASFHISAIIFVLLYPLCNWIKMTNKKYVWLIISGIIITVFVKTILETVLPVLFGEEKYIHYIEKETLPAFNLLIVMVLFFLVTFIVKSPSRNLLNYRTACFFAAMGQVLGIISPTASRLGYYFIPFIALAIPQTIYEADISSMNKSLISVGTVAFMIFFFFYAYSGGYLNVIPYSFFWE